MLNPRNIPWTLGTVRRGRPGRLGAPGEHLYHATSADRLVGIARNGLMPSTDPHWSGGLARWSLGKVFFSENIPTVAFYAAYIFSTALMQNEQAPDPALLRVHSLDLQDAEQDTASVDDWFIERTVPPSKINVWVPWLGDWASLRAAAHDMVDMKTVKGDPGEVDIDPQAGTHAYVEAYLTQLWPYPQKRR